MRKKLLTYATAAVLTLAPTAVFAQDGQSGTVTSPGTGGAAGVQVAADEAMAMSNAAWFGIGLGAIALGVGLGIGLNEGGTTGTTTTTN